VADDDHGHVNAMLKFRDKYDEVLSRQTKTQSRKIVKVDWSKLDTKVKLSDQAISGLFRLMANKDLVASRHTAASWFVKRLAAGNEVETKATAAAVTKFIERNPSLKTELTKSLIDAASNQIKAAIRSKQHDKLPTVLKFVQAVDDQRQVIMTHAIDALQNENKPAVKLFLDYLPDKDLNALSKRGGLGLLHRCARLNDRETAGILIARGAIPNLQNRNDQTPLVTAIEADNFDFAWFMVDVYFEQGISMTEAQAFNALEFMCQAYTHGAKVKTQKAVNPQTFFSKLPTVQMPDIVSKFTDYLSQVWPDKNKVDAFIASTEEKLGLVVSDDADSKLTAS